MIVISDACKISVIGIINAGPAKFIVEGSSKYTVIEHYFRSTERVTVVACVMMTAKFTVVTMVTSTYIDVTMVTAKITVVAMIIRYVTAITMAAKRLAVVTIVYSGWRMCTFPIPACCCSNYNFTSFSI